MNPILEKLPLDGSSAPAWLSAVKENFAAFLQDHAACERKAAALAMSLVAKYPDREALLEPMICLAKEELAHFHEVYRLMLKRGIPLANDEKDPYVASLLKQIRHGREEHFLDKLLISALIEARSCERLGLVSEGLDDPDLQVFYRRLAREEAGHYKIFLRLARLYFDDDVVQKRLQELVAIEAEAVRTLPVRAAVH